MDVGEAERQRRADWLRQQRQRVGLSGGKLAALVGVDTNHLLRIERGAVVTPSLPVCERWARALGLPRHAVASRFGLGRPRRLLALDRLAAAAEAYDDDPSGEATKELLDAAAAVRRADGKRTKREVV